MFKSPFQRQSKNFEDDESYQTCQLPPCHKGIEAGCSRRISTSCLASYTYYVKIKTVERNFGQGNKKKNISG